MDFTAAERLIHPVIIQQRTRTQSPSGAISEGWTDMLQTWAEVKPLRGRNVEIAAARTQGRSLSHQITMRYPGFDLDDEQNRIKFDQHIFELFSIVDVMERKIELDILANEKTD